MASQHRLTALDSIRGLAALCIAIGFHDVHFYYDPQNPLMTETPLMWKLSGIFANGWLCVDLFFVLSGFVISYVYLPRIEGGLSAWAFAWGRFSRIYPLHLATLAVVLATYAVRNAHGWGNFIFNADFNHLFNAITLIGYGLIDRRYEFNGPSWSISCELVCYALFYATVRFFLKWNTLFWIVFAMIGVLGIYLRANFYPVINLDMGRALFGFFTGCILLKAFTASNIAWRVIRMLWMVASCVFAAKLIFTGVLPYGLYLYVLFIFPGLITAAASLPWLAQSLSIRPLRWLGERSYTIYMVHYPLQCMFVTGAAMFAWHFNPNSAWFVLAYATIVLIVSALVFPFFERPMMLVLRAKAASKTNFQHHESVGETESPNASTD